MAIVLRIRHSDDDFSAVAKRKRCQEVPQEGWSGKKNGELVALMSAAGFEVLLTVDQGIPHQQNIQGISVAVVVMVGASNQLADLLLLVPDVLAALSGVQAGDTVEVRA